MSPIDRETIRQLGLVPLRRQRKLKDRLYSGCIQMAGPWDGASAVLSTYIVHGNEAGKPQDCLCHGSRSNADRQFVAGSVKVLRELTDTFQK